MRSIDGLGGRRYGGLFLRTSASLRTMRLHRYLLPSLCVPPRPLRLNNVRNRSPRIAVLPRRPQRNAEKRSRLRRLNLLAQRCGQTANDRRHERPTLRIPVSPHLCSYVHFAIQPIAAAFSPRPSAISAVKSYAPPVKHQTKGVFDGSPAISCTNFGTA